MADKENDEFEIDLTDIGGGDGDIDTLLAADEKDVPLVGGNDDDFIDFNDFSIDDLDTALSKYEASRNGEKKQAVADKPSPKPEMKGGGKKEPEMKAAKPNDAPVKNDMPAKNDMSAKNETAVKNDMSVKNDAPIKNDTAESKKAEPSALTKEDEQILGNLRWYDGTLGEKVYEISLNNMPEFLDYDKNIKVIHVNIDSPYGWNVFFENGVFMNLMDLKEYQERNGSLPGANGKIIYGSRMSSFEKIERIVVYEKPRYFSYGLKK